MTVSALPRRALVLAADRWHVDFMGVYGNDWIETPALQRLASEGVVFDAHFAATLDAPRAAAAWWSARIPATEAGAEGGAAPDWSAIESLNAAGVHTVLLVENPQDRPGVVLPPFAEVVTVEAVDDLDAAESQMPWARLVQRTEEWLQANVGRAEPVLLWLWTRGVPVPWLPPRDFADLYLEDFGLALPEPAGPAPAEGLTPEPLLLPEEMEEEDESELVAWAEEEDLTTDQDRIPEEVRFALALYASYASVLDRWLGRLLRSVHESPEWREGVVVFTAAMGQAVFEPPGSPRAGELVPEEAPPPCRGEVLQTPLIVRLPGGASARVSAAAGEGTVPGTVSTPGPVAVPGPNGNVVTQRGTRRRGLVSTIDLGPTLGEWFGVAALPQWQGRSVWPLIRQEVEAIHDEVLTTLPTGGWALRTPEYLLVEEPEQGDAGEEQPGERSRERGEQMTRLYEKPVDRWDVADVARQQPGVVDELRQWLGRRREELQQAGESGA